MSDLGHIVVWRRCERDLEYKECKVGTGGRGRRPGPQAGPAGPTGIAESSKYAVETSRNEAQAPQREHSIGPRREGHSDTQ